MPPKLVLPHMRAQRSGTIVNVTSMGGKVYTPLGGWYHATKFALEALSDCLRLEVKPFGVNVVVIEPGGVRTEWPGVTAGKLRKASPTGGGPQLGWRPSSGVPGHPFAIGRFQRAAVCASHLGSSVPRCRRRAAGLVAAGDRTSPYDPRGGPVDQRPDGGAT